MRILVDINHPHHVHLFKNAIALLKKRGHQILIVARDKDVTTHLLKNFDLPYQLSAKMRSGMLILPFAVVELDWKIWEFAKDFDPDLMIGTSFAIAHISKLIRARSVVFSEDNLDSDRLFWLIVRPFADYIVTPNTLGNDFGKKHIVYSGYQELAYLHPNYFRPDPRVLEEQGIGRDEGYSILRLVSLKASHDIGQHGINDDFRDKVFDLLSENGRVVISSEEKLPSKYQKFQLRVSPERLHHLMAFARLLVSDSQTMTIESAVMGVPAIRCNTFVGRAPVIEEIEHKYGLTFGFLPDQENEMLDKITQVFKTYPTHMWKEKRESMLKEKIDLTSWMVDFLEGLNEI